MVQPGHERGRQGRASMGSIPIIPPHHNKAQGSGSPSWSGVAKGPVAGHAIAYTGRDVHRSRGDGSVTTGMCTNPRSLCAPGCAAVCPGLPSPKPPCPLQGPIITLLQNPHGSVLGRDGRQSRFAATTFIPRREKGSSLTEASYTAECI